MLQIKCPLCNANGDETDFLCTGEAYITRPASKNFDKVTLNQQLEYLFNKKNPKGKHYEMWQCLRGCEKYFILARNTNNLKILEYKHFGQTLATEVIPKKKIIRRKNTTKSKNDR